MDGKSRYGTNRVIKDRNVLERSDSKHNEDGPEPCVSPNDDATIRTAVDFLTVQEYSLKKRLMHQMSPNIAFVLLMRLSAASQWGRPPSDPGRFVKMLHKT
ncbi:hypothetical protein AC249_AIPGENE15277 [Exaiptasia diaphana]|nr:hypothetical protein AC249_AIPGENE15277 [Exaiptasia diaphana]